MPDSESPPPQALSLGSPWLDAAAVGGLLLAANAIAAPQDPGWLSLNPSPWLLLPVLTGLGHGFRWGFLFGSAASLTILGVLSALHPAALPANLVYYFSLPAAGLVAGGAYRVAGPARDWKSESESGDSHATGLPLEPGVMERDLETAWNLPAGSSHPIPESTPIPEQELENLKVLQDELQARLTEREGEIRSLARQRDALAAGLAERDEALRRLEKVSLEAAPSPAAAREAELAEGAASREMLAAQREELSAQLAEREETLKDLSGQRDALAARLDDHAETLRGLAAERDDFAARLAEQAKFLGSLSAEREVLSAKLMDREDALRRAEDMRDSLNARLADRNALLESLAARPAPAKRRMPRNGVLQIHSSGRLGSTREAEDALALAPAEPSQLQEMLLPLDADVVPLDERIRALFAKNAGLIFPNLLQLLEDIAGVTDAAVYQIDGPRLQRSALQGAEGKLPEMLPLAAAEIAHLAVTRQSFVTCRQVWATVPAQTSPWLAALPWPTTEMHSSALLLIHRMHFGAVNWQTFSRIQMVCRWVALFMELHGIKTTGNAAADAGAGAGGPLVVTPDILRRAAVDAAAAHREHTLPSSAVTLQLTPDASSSQAEQLLATILPQLRPTDLVALHPAGAEASGPAENGGVGGRGAALEVLLTFSDREDAETIIRRLTEVLSGDPELHAAVKVGAPTQIGAPARN